MQTHFATSRARHESMPKSVGSVTSTASSMERQSSNLAQTQGHVRASDFSRAQHTLHFSVDEIRDKLPGLTNLKYEYHYSVMNIIKIGMNWKDATLDFGKSKATAWS